MESADQELGAAHVQVDEWVGTAAAENDMTVYSKSVYDVVGLSRADWSILAIEFGDGTASTSSSVDVYAIDRNKHDLLGLSHEKLIALADDRGSLPVTHFKVHGVRAETIIKESFKRYRVQLRARSIANLTLNVEQRDDLKLND
ncbi:hypothetical protein [Conyzicola sp.]|uniref:hypothetical protein n=1 Tax=Conyzicola sp. TaxID=1969404 RepID=UPI0039894CDC